MGGKAPTTRAAAQQAAQLSSFGNRHPQQSGGGVVRWRRWASYPVVDIGGSGGSSAILGGGSTAGGGTGAGGANGIVLAAAADVDMAKQKTLAFRVPKWVAEADAADGDDADDNDTAATAVAAAGAAGGKDNGDAQNGAQKEKAGDKRKGDILLDDRLVMPKVYRRARQTLEVGDALAPLAVAATAAVGAAPTTEPLAGVAVVEMSDVPTASTGLQLGPNTSSGTVDAMDVTTGASETEGGLPAEVQDAGLAEAEAAQQLAESLVNGAPATATGDGAKIDTTAPTEGARQPVDTAADITAAQVATAVEGSGAAEEAVIHETNPAAIAQQQLQQVRQQEREKEKETEPQPTTVHEVRDPHAERIQAEAAVPGADRPKDAFRMDGSPVIGGVGNGAGNATVGQIASADGINAAASADPGVKKEQPIQAALDVLPGLAVVQPSAAGADSAAAAGGDGIIDGESEIDSEKRKRELDGDARIDSELPDSRAAALLQQAGAPLGNVAAAAASDDGAVQGLQLHDTIVPETELATEPTAGERAPGTEAEGVRGVQVKQSEIEDVHMSDGVAPDTDAAPDADSISARNVSAENEGEVGPGVLDRPAVSANVVHGLGAGTGADTGADSGADTGAHTVAGAGVANGDDAAGRSVAENGGKRLKVLPNTSAPLNTDLLADGVAENVQVIEDGAEGMDDISTS